MTNSHPSPDTVGELKPCPHCKSTKVFISEADREVVAQVYVACGDCGATGPGVDEDDFPTEKAIRAEVIRLWNTRSESEQITVMREALEELAATADALENVLSADPEMPTYQADYDAAEARLESVRAYLAKLSHGSVAHDQ